MYIILREVNSTLLKRISLTEDGLDSRKDVKYTLNII